MLNKGNINDQLLLPGQIRKIVLALFVSALIILWLAQYTNLDLAIEDYYFDSQTKMFFWKSSWFAKQFMHVYVKNAIIGIGILLISFVIVDAIARFNQIENQTRWRLRFVASSAILIPTTISILKHRSILHCPWDIQRYGGEAPFIRVLGQIPHGMLPGHCFPAGHASTGLWLSACCIFWLPHNPKKALLIFLAGIGLGFSMGWVQQMRGAHFLSHTLWSVWVASFMIFLMLLISNYILIRTLPK